MRSRLLPGAQDNMQRKSVWFLILFLFLAGCQAQGSFKPDEAGATPVGDLLRRPVIVSFEELDVDPRAYQNQLVRVTGALLQVPSLPCSPVNGPVPQWALVDEELQLNGRGFERVLHLVPEGTELMVDGFWHRYRGPVGCGKEPPVDTIWYLEAVRLVQPNPIPGLEGLLATGSPRVTIEPVATLPAEGTATGTATPSSTPTATITGTPTLMTMTPSPTATVEGTPAEAITATPSLTPRPGETLTATPTPSQTPTPTATTAGASTPTLQPPTATNEPPEYPPATGTTDPYD